MGYFEFFMDLSEISWDIMGFQVNLAKLVEFTEGSMMYATSN